MTRLHAVKSWPPFFRPIINGSRTHDMRRNDRNYKVGDTLHLQEYNPVTLEYTGAMANARITHITENVHNPCAESPKGLNDGYCILSIKLLNWNDK